MQVRIGALALLSVVAGCRSPSPPPPPPPTTPDPVPMTAPPDAKPHPEPERCEAIARFHAADAPNAWSLATLRMQHRDCSSGTCMSIVEARPFHGLRGPAIPTLQGGLPNAVAERLVHRRDEYVLLAAHVGPERSTLSWAYPLYFAAEGESMMAVLDRGECPPMRLPRDAECAQCEPDPDCPTGCCRWEDDACGMERTCARQFECAPACCES